MRRTVGPRRPEDVTRDLHPASRSDRVGPGGRGQGRVVVGGLCYPAREMAALIREVLPPVTPTSGLRWVESLAFGDWRGQLFLYGLAVALGWAFPELVGKWRAIHATPTPQNAPTEFATYFVGVFFLVVVSGVVFWRAAVVARAQRDSEGVWEQRVARLQEALDRVHENFFGRSRAVRVSLMWVLEGPTGRYVQALLRAHKRDLRSSLKIPEGKGIVGRAWHEQNRDFGFPGAALVLRVAAFDPNAPDAYAQAIGLDTALVKTMAQKPRSFLCIAIEDHDRIPIGFWSIDGVDGDSILDELIDAPALGATGGVPQGAGAAPAALGQAPQPLGAQGQAPQPPAGAGAAPQAGVNMGANVPGTVPSQQGTDRLAPLIDMLEVEGHRFLAPIMEKLRAK